MFTRVDDNNNVVYATIYFDNLKLWMEAAEELGLMYQVYKHNIFVLEAHDKYPDLYTKIEWHDKVYNDTVTIYTFLLEMPKR